MYLYKYIASVLKSMQITHKTNTLLVWRMEECKPTEKGEVASEFSKNFLSIYRRFTLLAKNISCESSKNPTSSDKCLDPYLLSNIAKIVYDHDV